MGSPDYIQQKPLPVKTRVSKTENSAKLSRRQFMEKTLIGGAGLIAGTSGLMAHSVRPWNISANDKINIGVMGLGVRNLFLIRRFIEQGAEITHVCDVDTRRFDRGLEACSDQRRRPVAVQDFRRMLDNRDITAMIIAPGTHWAPLATIMACQAGKDVYVEKPMSHNVYEGRKMAEASSKYKQIVQVGCQNRSGEYHRRAIAFLKAGNIGKIHHVRVLNMLKEPLGRPGPYPEMPVPPEVDYDMWCGPAPKRPYNINRTAPGVWRYFWDYSGSDSESIHQLDIASWIISELTGRGYPKSLYAKGTVHYPDRVADIPDSLSVIYDYDDITLSLQVDWWTSLIKVPLETRASNSLFPDWSRTGTRIEIYGTNGMMYLGRHGGGWQAYDVNGELIAQEAGNNPNEEHVKNFLDCIRSRQIPNGDIERCQISQAMSHMAYISYRVGNQLLKIDGEKERFLSNYDANVLLKRQECARPWEVPNVV
jgi:predicted dehydrogenase